ncbi:uncharacterized protein [Amphiura filiformis]|uniref:uncharacterized protein isoform X1 n=1 Tax=Amphiura filiformis TaxID=82378 RepID=UPI003B2237F2
MADLNDFVPVLNDPLTAPSFYYNEHNIQNFQRWSTINIKDDNPGVCEAIKTFNVYLGNIIGGIPGERSSTRVKIIDDDTVSFSLAQDTFTTIEGGGSVAIEILRSGAGTMQPGSAELTFTDKTATSADYNNLQFTVNFDVSNSANTESGAVEIKNDERYEETESFNVNLGTLTPDGCSSYGQYESAVVVITDDDSRFRFVVESGASIIIPEGGSRLFEISRVGTVQSKTVEIVINEGTADLGDDYTISPAPVGSVSSVVFPAGDDDATITIATEDDEEFEGSETFTLTLRDPLYPKGNRADPYSLIISIADNHGNSSTNVATEVSTITIVIAAAVAFAVGIIATIILVAIGIYCKRKTKPEEGISSYSTYVASPSTTQGSIIIPQSSTVQSTAQYSNTSNPVEGHYDDTGIEIPLDNMGYESLGADRGVPNSYQGLYSSVR